MTTKKIKGGKKAQTKIQELERRVEWLESVLRWQYPNGFVFPLPQQPLPPQNPNSEEVNNMKTNKRRLLKDLPFDHCKKGVVLWKGSRGTGGTYSVTGRKTFYSGGGSSDNGIWVFDRQTEEILDLIWNNDEWFEDAILSHIDFSHTNETVTLRFPSLDAEDAYNLMRGIIHILPHLKDKGWVWSEFPELTTEIKNA